MNKRRRRSGSDPAGGQTPNDPGQSPGPGQPIAYQIRIRAHLDEQWADWIEGLTVTLEESGDTLLTVPVVDQAALYGLLRKLRDLGVPLISISPAEPDRLEKSSKEEERR